MEIAENLIRLPAKVFHAEKPFCIATNDPLTHEVQEPKCTSQAHMIFRRRIRIGSSYARVPALA